MYKKISRAEAITKIVIPKLLVSSLQVLLGAIFFSVLAQIKVQVGLVPMTLQTLGVFLLAFSLGGRKAAGALVVYLAEATFGWPVLAGGQVNPLWFLGPTAGYLVAFPIAAYVIGSLLKNMKKPSIIWIVCVSCLGLSLIYLLGVAWLAHLVGVKKGLIAGLMPFIGIDCIKMALAICLFFPIHWVKNKVDFFK